MKNLIFFLSLFATLFGSSCQQKEAITLLGREQFEKAIMASNVQLVDVRTPEEYAAGYIKDAVNIDYYDEEHFKETFENFDKSQPLYLYCQSGGRSQKAAAILVDLGFEEIYDLEGGYLNWEP